MAALDAGRSVILNDLNTEYCDLMRERLAAWPDDLAGPVSATVQEEAEELPLFRQIEEVIQC